MSDDVKFEGFWKQYLFELVWHILLDMDMAVLL